MMQAVTKTHALQHSASALPGFLLMDIGVTHGQHHILQRGEMSQQMILLEHKAQLLAAQFWQLAVRRLHQIYTIEKHCARSGFIHTAQDIEQRGFSAARGSHHRKEFTSLDQQIQALQSMDFHGAHQIRFE